MCSVYLTMLFDGDAMAVRDVIVLERAHAVQVHDRSWRNILLQTQSYLYTYTITDEACIHHAPRHSSMHHACC